MFRNAVALPPGDTSRYRAAAAGGEGLERVRKVAENNDSWRVGIELQAALMKAVDLTKSHSVLAETFILSYQNPT